MAALPHSCCRNDDGQGTTCSKSESWQEGCLQKSINVVKEKSGLLFKIVVGIAGGEVLYFILHNHHLKNKNKNKKFLKEIKEKTFKMFKSKF